MASSVFDFHCQSIDGRDVPLAHFRGKVMLIVNTASYCGFTSQFRGLELLYRRYQDRGFVVLGFPCNQFASQDPFGNERINDFCTRNYAVSFPMFAKIRVNGAHAEPLFGYLKKQAPGLFGLRPIKWNFTKFLLDRDGRVVGRYGPASFPTLLSRKIDRLLAH